MTDLDALLAQRSFSAKLGNRTYSDRLAYEKAAKGLIDGAEPRRIKPGLDVCFDPSGRSGVVGMTWGQVWDAAPARGHWWIVADDGRVFEWSRSGCQQVTAQGIPVKASA